MKRGNLRANVKGEYQVEEPQDTEYQCSQRGRPSRSSEEVSVMEMEQRGEQSIGFSRVSIAEKTTSAVINRGKGGRIERDGKERTHEHK